MLNRQSNRTVNANVAKQDLNLLRSLFRSLFRSGTFAMSVRISHLPISHLPTNPCQGGSGPCTQVSVTTIERLFAVSIKGGRDVQL